MNSKTKKIIITSIPYLFVALLCSKLGLAWRLAEGADASAKMLNLLGTLATAFSTLTPSFHPFDLCVGLISGCILSHRLKVKPTDVFETFETDASDESTAADEN